MSFIRPRKGPESRVGSGGATLNIIRRILDDVDHQENSKILLIHSGGLSQRMPHFSVYGKVFGMLPNGKTILQTKLEIYKSFLLENLPSTGGVMISASDVIEDMKMLRKVENSDVDVVIFAHSSSLEVGTGHGVFVMDQETNQLKRVLQKPSIEEMRLEGAVRNDESVLTDSCYFMSWKFCRKLLETQLLRSPPTVELCCYGDFMRPMGNHPSTDYIESSPPELQKYRKALANVFSKAQVKIVELGENSFFHFGTYKEFIEHLLPDSKFRSAFGQFSMSNVIQSIGFHNVPNSSFVEFSVGSNLKVGEKCLVSSVEATNLATYEIPSKTVVFTIQLKNEFVTVMFYMEDDIKKKRNRLKWNGHDTGIEGESLWTAPVFKVCSGGESLGETLDEWQNGLKKDGMERVSIEEALRRSDVRRQIERRANLSLKINAGL